EIQRGSTATSAIKQTSRIRQSRPPHGSWPRTFNSPSYGVSPRIALRVVVLPAPFRPISPTMRPSSIRRSTPSSTTFPPNALRRPRASMHGIASVSTFLFRFRTALAAVEQILDGEPQSLDGLLDPGPFLRNELLALALEQQVARAIDDEHPKAAPGFY